MHELKHELITSVRFASRYPSCGHDMRIDKAVGGVTSTQRELSENFIQLDVRALLDVGFMIVLRRAGW